MIYIDTKHNTLTMLCRYSGSTKVMKKKYPISSGSKEKPTPLGKFHITRKIISPEKYYHDITPQEVEKFKPAVLELNIHFQKKPYAIHGRDPGLVLAQQHTGGCIAMLDDDLIEVFNWVEKGQPVIIWDKLLKDVDFGDIPDYNRLRNWSIEKARINGNQKQL